MTDRTHGPFQVGDMVEVISTTYKKNDYKIGSIGRIVGVKPDAWWAATKQNFFGYQTTVNNPGKFFKAEQIRKIDPPKSDQSQWQRQATCSWDQIQRETGWQPVRERV